MPASITLTDAFNRQSIVFPSQISHFRAGTAYGRPDLLSYINVGRNGAFYTNSMESIITATSGLCIPLNIVATTQWHMLNAPRTDYYATRLILSFAATNSTMPLFGTPGFNTRVELRDESDPTRVGFYLYVSQTVAEIRAIYDGTAMTSSEYVNSITTCDGERETGEVVMPCHVTGVTIGSDPTVLRGHVLVPQVIPGVDSVTLGSNSPEAGNVNIPVGSTSALATLISGTELSSIRTSIANGTNRGVASVQVGSETASQTGNPYIEGYIGVDDTTLLPLEENGFFLMGQRAIKKLVSLIKKVQVPYSITLDPLFYAGQGIPANVNIVNFVTTTTNQSGTYQLDRIMEKEASPMIINFSPSALNLFISADRGDFIPLWDNSVETQTLRIPDGTKSIRLIPFRKTNTNWPFQTPSRFFAYVQIIR